MSSGRCILCQKDSIAPLLNPFRNKNKTVRGYVNLQNNIEECQRREVPFLVGMLAHLNELQEGGGIIQILKKEKAKWHKNCTLGLSASKYVK